MARSTYEYSKTEKLNPKNRLFTLHGGTKLPILAPECIDKYDTETCGGGSHSESTPSEDEGIDHHDTIKEEESHFGMASVVDASN